MAIHYRLRVAAIGKEDKSCESDNIPDDDDFDSYEEEWRRWIRRIN